MTENSDINYKSMIDYHYPNNYSSAREIVPYIMECINPKSVIDIGCGVGAWLKVFEDSGVTVKGIDGEWIKNEKTLIKKSDIRVENLEKIQAGKEEHYDLAISLEVAEHIEAKYANNIVNYLISVSDVILFGAATPNSGGQHHVNERWQSYWIKKFSKKGYKAIDCIRPRYWNNIKVSYHYSQETFIFIKQDKLEAYPLLKKYMCDDTTIFDIVHPELFGNQVIKPTHNWEYLLNMQKKLLYSYKEKIRKEILQKK